MYNKVIHYLSAKHLAVWVVFVLDLFWVAFSYFLATALRFNFDLVKITIPQIWSDIAITTIIYGCFFYFLRSYKGVVRHSSILDLQRLIIAALYSSGVLIVANIILFSFFNYSGFFLLPKSILIIQFLLASFFMSSFRLIVKSVYASFINSYSLLKKRVMIYGAGSAGLITKNTLSQNSHRLTVYGFIDDNPSTAGKRLEGLPIMTTSKFMDKEFVEKNNIGEVIISLADVRMSNKRKVIEFCLENKIDIKEVPPYHKWIGGELSSKQIRPVRIEDLLDRGVIDLDNININNELKGKSIFVTGGAGSIGSEIVRQCLYYDIKRVIAIDQGESALHELSIELNNSKSDKDKFELIIGDITNKSKMKKLFQEYRPDIVFHAAAYKHVPLMEMNPSEAVTNNVFGTNLMANLSVDFGVKKFVLVSTDKAVNPTNVMGASKRAAEHCVQSWNAIQNTCSFIITRFGNVLGSNGSVIPLFKEQIERGGPITVTHKEVTRYFMTIPEACNLVLEAGSMGKGGEIFVFDMGEAIKIYDLAVKMIRLSGLTLDKDIEIKVTGLRPGEKLFEELLAVNENTIHTHHEKILKAQLANVNVDSVKKSLLELESAIKEGSEMNIVYALKNMVPEFKSQNSKFELLDRTNEALAS